MHDDEARECVGPARRPDDRPGAPRRGPGRRGVILADTSAWVEYDRATGSAVDQRLTELISTGGPLAVTEPVIMEVVAGGGTGGREADLRRLLLRFDLLRFDAAADFDAATRIYRSCRRAGVTPRGMVDCLIASVANRCGATLLASDAGMCRVARVVGIDMDVASMGAWREPSPAES